jgi:hypothetical protein
LYEACLVQEYINFIGVKATDVENIQGLQLIRP